MHSLLSVFDGAGPGIWRLSWHAAILALVMFGVLFCLGKRVPARWQCLMWTLVFVRLVTPSLPETSWSVFNWVPVLRLEQPTVTPSAVHGHVPSGPPIGELDPIASSSRVPTEASQSDSDDAERAADTNNI